MERLKKIIDIKKASFILIALPYLFFHWEINYYSPFFTYTNLLLSIASLITIEVILQLLISMPIKRIEMVTMVIVFVSILFFYGIVITSVITKLVNDYLGLIIRGRTVILCCFIVFCWVFFKMNRKKISYRILNVFLLIFSLVTLVVHSKRTKLTKDIHSLPDNFKHISLADKGQKPVILIICDEYSSPNDLYKINKDSTIYNFSKNRTAQGWIVKNNFHSYEKSTIHSLSSLFNFNLSVNSNYSKQPVPKVGAYKLVHASIADSLESKKVKIINYGIFDIGKSKPLNQLYFYPKNFLENLLMYTSYYILKYNAAGLDPNGLAESYYPSEKHHNHIFKTLSDTAQSVEKSKAFIYVHFFMPHSPFVFGNEFPLRKIRNLTNYEAYWRFTNRKIEKLLVNLCKENKYRIILTGDHGFREDSRVDFHNTFAAFYGFDQPALDNIKSVQDLGSLINASF